MTFLLGVQVIYCQRVFLFIIFSKNLTDWSFQKITSYLSRKRLHCQGRTFFVIYYLTCLGSFFVGIFFSVYRLFIFRKSLMFTLYRKIWQIFLHCSANAKDFFLNPYSHVEFLFKLFVKSVSKWDFLKIIKL